MADVYRTDEEQVEVIQRWWKENGNSTLISIGAALVLYFGWTSWEANTKAEMDSASTIYQQLLVTAEQLTTAATPELYGTAASLNDRLQEEYKGSSYAEYGAMLQARFLVDQGNAAAAAGQLESVLASTSDEAVKQVANLRLGQLKLQQGDAVGARQIAASVSTGPFAAAYAELEGDAQVKLANIPAARTAYQRSVDLSNQDGGQGPGFVQLKLDGLVDLTAASQQSAAVTSDVLVAAEPEVEQQVQEIEDAAEAVLETEAEDTMLPPGEGDEEQ